MLKAIETQYKGYRFRSRLEARWAVFFDTLRIPYQYEPEGFDLDGLWYLPDFYLPKHRYWLEVKPSYPTGGHQRGSDLDKINRFAATLNGLEGDAYRYWCDDVESPIGETGATDDIGGKFVVLVGPPQVPSKPGLIEGSIDFQTMGHYLWAPHWDNYHWWCECPYCHEFGITFEGRAARLSCGCVKHRDPLEDRSHTADSERLAAAYAASRAARFGR